METDAVIVEQAVAGYGKKKILNGLSMRVRRGTIYALLGPSGCGKTTLLSCILGRKNLRSGDITVFNGVPGDRAIGLPGGLVGYMPQDICLYQEFTIQETFQYFGRLQRLSKDSLEKKQIALLDLLDLPEGARRVSALSGGQKRRLSFAVALLHNPKLLILDEPTVGVDPVVRARIWQHLQSLTTSGVSIIITTHYIEEARDAHMVGIMRNGRLLAQEPPGLLMERHQAQTLEKVFLRLCIETDQSEIDDYRLSTKTQSLQSVSIGPDEAEVMNAKLIKKTPKRKPKTFVLPSIHNIAALFVKNWITMKRNILLLLFVFFLPGIVLLINSIMIGQEPKNLPIAIVNMENDCSENYYKTSCEANLLGCYFQQSLNESSLVNLIPYKNITQARLDTMHGLVKGSIVVPEKFSTSYLKKVLDKDLFEDFLYFFDQQDNANPNETISVALDVSDPQLDLFMKKAISDSMDNLITNVSEICKDRLPEGGLDLKMFKMEAPLLGTSDSDYREFITPGMICVAIFFLAMALTSESFISERSQGLLERSWITGVLPVEIIASYIMSQFLVMVMQATITLITVFVIFRIPCHGPVGWLVVLTLFQGLAGMTFGFFLSTVCNTSMDAMKLSIGACFPNMLLCGIIWPIEGMPQAWMITFAKFLPHTEAVQGMRDIMLRGWGVWESNSIWYGLGVSSAWISIFLLLSWFLVTRKLS